MEYRIVKKHGFEIYSIEELFRSFFIKSWGRIGYWNYAHVFHFYEFDKKSDAKRYIEKLERINNEAKAKWEIC